MLRHATHQLSPVNAQQDLKAAFIRGTYENTANCSTIDTYFSGGSGGGPIKVWSGGDGRLRQGGALCGKAQGESASWALPHGIDIQPRSEDRSSRMYSRSCPPSGLFLCDLTILHKY